LQICIFVLIFRKFLSKYENVLRHLTPNCLLTYIAMSGLLKNDNKI